MSTTFAPIITEEDSTYARSLGWFPGEEAGYSQTGLWLRDHGVFIQFFGMQAREHDWVVVMVDPQSRIAINPRPTSRPSGTRSTLASDLNELGLAVWLIPTITRDEDITNGRHRLSKLQ